MSGRRGAGVGVANVERRSYPRRDGSRTERFRVRWIDEDGERQAETFASEAEAVAFREELARRAARLRGGPLERRQVTFADATQRWWTEHAVPTLAQRTRENYARSWSRHVGPRLGEVLVTDLTPVVLEQLKDEMLADGLGASTVRHAMALVQSVLAHSVRRGLADSNAAAAIRKPPVRRTRKRRMPASIAAVEHMRRIAVEDFASPVTAVALSIGAYAGLRPGEWRALTWSRLGEQTIHVADAVDVDGSLRGETKTSRDRAAELLPVLADDLAAWRAITPFPEDEHPIVPTARGGHFTDEDYRNFVNRKFRPATTAAGWRCTPYDLRHFNASLLLKEGRLSLPELAGHMGHTLAELSRTYAREMAEYRGRHMDVLQEVRELRAEHGEPLRRLAEELGADVPPPRPPTTRTAVASAGTELLGKLVDLNRAGVLSDEELAAKVRSLL